MQKCPTNEELRAFVLGNVDDDEAETIVNHLDECTVCDSAAASLDQSSDSLISELRRPAASQEFVNEHEFQQAAELIAAIGQNPNASMAGLDQTVAKLNLGTLGQYKLLAKLGEGGMGTVYKALHTRLEKIVAVKVLPADRLLDEGAIARFDREMKAVGKLDHPNIVRASDAGESDGTHFLVMEYVKGYDLSQLVQRVGPLPIADACELIRQAAIGLQHAHENGLVHRDIKPSNLMFAASRNKSSVGTEPSPPLTASPQPSIKILDLGLALLQDQHAEGARELTNTGQMMGTLDYMAPEQGDDSHEVDIRADIYSLGATLYKLLCGEAPFAGDKFNTPVKKMMALAMEEPEPIHERRSDVPIELSAVVHQMLAKAPDDRFKTPAEVAQALAPFTPRSDLSHLLTKSSDGVDSSLSSDQKQGSTEPQLSSLRDTSSTMAKDADPIQPMPIAPRRPMWKPVMISAALAGILLLAILLSISTPDGIVTVEVPDASNTDIHIHVKQGGRKVAIIDAQSKWQIEVDEGEYHVELAGGEDQFEIKNDKVTVSSDKKARVVVTLKRNEPEAPVVPASPRGANVIKSFTSKDKPIEQTGVMPAEDGWKLTAEHSTVFRLFQVPNPSVDNCLVTYRARIKSEDVQKQAYLEMWVRLPGGGEYFSQGLHNAVTGTNDWTTIEIFFRLEKGQRPDLIKLHFVAAGKGTIWIKDVEVLHSELPTATAATNVPSPIAKWLNPTSTGTSKPALPNKPVRQLVVSANLRATFDEHEEWFGGVTFSRDDKLLLDSGQDKSIRVWDIATGESVKQMLGHKSPVHHMAFSPDGKVMASTACNEEIRMWTLGQAEPIATLRGHVMCTPCVAFAPDGQTLASCSRDNTVKLWDVKSATVRKTLRGDFKESDSVVLSSDGRFVAAGSRNGLLTIWDAKSGDRLHAIQAYDQRTTCLSLSPDNRVLATSSSRFGSIRLWNPITGKQIALLETESLANRRVAFSPRGDLLAAGSLEGTIRIWDAMTYRLLTVIDGHNDAIEGLAFNGAGTMLATGSRDRTAKLWDIRVEPLSPRPEDEQRRLVGHTSRVTALAFAWDSKRVISAADDRTIRLWDIGAGGQFQEIVAPAVNIECLAISSDGQLAVSGDEQRATLWDLKKGEEVKKLDGQKFVQSAVFSRYDEFVLVGGLDQIRLYSVATGQRVREYQAKQSKEKAKRFSGLVFLDDARSFLSFGLFKGAVIQHWDIENSEPLRSTKLKGFVGGVQKPRFSPDGRLIAIAATDTSIGVWDTETGELVKKFEDIAEKVYSVAFSCGGRYIAAGSRDQEIRVWDVQTGDLFHTVSADTPCTNQLAFSPNGEYIVSAGGNLRRGEPGSEGDCSLHVWRLPSLEETSVLPKPKPPTLWPGEVRRFAAGLWRAEQVAFSPDGRQIISGHTNAIGAYDPRNTVRIWDVESGKQLHDLVGHPKSVHSVAFAPDGRFAASAGGDRLRLWNVTTGEQVEEMSYDVGSGGAVVFTADGKQLACSNSKKAATVFDVVSGKRHSLAKVPADINSFSRSAISLDARVILYGSPKKLVAWDIEKNQELHSHEIDTRRLESLCISPDGRFAFAGGESKSFQEFFRMWGLETGKEIPKPSFISGRIFGAAFSPDSRYAAVGLPESVIVVWELESGLEIARYKGDKEINQTLAFSPDGNYLLSAGGKRDVLGRTFHDGDYDLHLWQLPKIVAADTAIDLLDLIDLSKDAVTGDWEIKDGALRLVPGGPYPRLSIPVVPERSYELSIQFNGAKKAGGHGGVILAVAGRQVLLSLGVSKDNKLQIGLDQVSGKRATPDTDAELLPDKTQELLIQVRVAGEEAAILAKLNGQKVVEWQGTTKELSLAEPWALDRPNTLGFGAAVPFRSVHGATLTMRDGRAKVLRPKPTRLGLSVNANLRHTFPDHQGWFGGVTFSPDGKMLASGNKKHMIVLRDAKTGEVVKEMKGHKRQIHLVRFSPDGKLLASTACNEELRLWEVARGEEIATMRGHIMCTPWIDWSPDGETLASCSRDKTVKLWDIASASIRKTLRTTEAERDCVDISPDGTMIAAGTRGGWVSIWDADGNELRTFRPHQKNLGALEFSPDSKLLAVNGPSDGATILIIDPATGEQLQTLAPDTSTDPFQALTWSPDGRFLACGGAVENPNVQIWEMGSGRQLAALDGHKNIIFSLAFSPDGRLLASGSKDETIRVWELDFGYAPLPDEPPAQPEQNDAAAKEPTVPDDPGKDLVNETAE
jgi:WD40 repeat protein/serine/threonine protein kinase